MPTIHSTAIISREAILADDVSVGPYAIIDGPVTLGPGCTIHPRAHLLGPLTMGARNSVHSGAVIGDLPQDRKFKKEEFSQTLIGDDNIFREQVTIHRGTGTNTKTTIGHRNFFLVGSHVGHNASVANDVTLINGAALGGHASIGDRAILGAYRAIHQFCRVGRLAMLSTANFNVDFPPFFLSMATNTVHQLNAVGLRRSGMPKSSIDALRRMFQLAFRDNRRKPLSVALASIPDDLLQVPEVAEVITFCTTAKRGIAKFIPWSRRKNLLSIDMPPAE